ncbi:MAG: nucleotide exchange factor GrpE [Desulfobacteraceae bacterium]|nr:MAG: nucleotide exchange factor GrpE [Desulfobacteraceae bacterium]
MVLKNNTKSKKSQQSKKSTESKKPKKMPAESKTQAEGDEKITETNQLEELTAELAAEKDRVLRVSAEFENFKRRKQKEIEDFRKFANESLFKQLLTVVDNLERAIDSAENGNADPKDLAEGVKLTHKEILKMFDTFNVKPIDAKDNAFDPNFHQAVTQTETDEYPENTVINELQKGYLLHDRLLRPSMVVVSKSVEKKTEDE